MKNIFFKAGMAAGIAFSMAAGVATTAEAATITQSQRVTGFADATGFGRPDPFGISFTNLPTSGQNGTLSIQTVGDFRFAIDDANEWVNVVLDPFTTSFNLGRLFDTDPDNDRWTSSEDPLDLGRQYGEPLSATASIPDRVLNRLLNNGTINARVSFGPEVDNLSSPREEFVELTLSFDSAEPIPTPALLPGLLGMGFAALRKKTSEAVEEV